MPLQAIEPRRLYRQIADQLRALIAAGEFPVGSRLPGERELAAQLGVSRPSVREALIALEVEGLVEVRMGSGIYVKALDAPRSRQLDTTLGPFEIIRARQVVEGELAALAAQLDDKATREALVRDLNDAIAQMQTDIAAGHMPIHSDRRFHLAIAEACANGALERVVTDLYDERNNPLFERLGAHFEHVASWQAAVTEHRAVVAAIAAGDAAAARAAMHHHLQLSHDRFAVGNWTRDSAPAPSSVPRKALTP